VEKILSTYALGLHLAAQQPAFGAQGLAAQQPFFAEQDAAAQQPALVALAFFTFLGFAEQAPQLLRDIGAQVAEAAVGATAMVRPPATASIVARLSDFDILESPKIQGLKQGCYPWPGMGKRRTLMASKKMVRIRKFSAIRHWLWK
jgi:hypothetical protein